MALPTDFVIVPSTEDSKGKQAGGIGQSSIKPTKLTNDSKLTDKRSIIQCIGQLLSDFGVTSEGADGTMQPKLFGGTGTVIERLDNDLVAVLTCAHNVAKNQEDFDDEEEEEDEDDDDEDEDEDKIQCKKAEKIYFRPNPTDIKSVMKCVDFQYHYKYDPNTKKSIHDLAVIIFKDTNKYYEKTDFASLEIPICGKDNTFDAEIFGYPLEYIDPKNNYLYGERGSVKIIKKKKYKYSIPTFPGHSGAAIFNQPSKEVQEKFNIYGIHTFGDVRKQVNWGIKFNENNRNWIDSVITSMESNIKAREEKDDETNDEINEVANCSVDDYKSGDEQGGIIENAQAFLKGLTSLGSSNTKTFKVGHQLAKISPSKQARIAAKEVYKKQLSCLEPSIFDNDDLMYFLAVQSQYKVPFLGFLVDWYYKEKQEKQEKQLSVEQWMEDNKFMQKVKKIDDEAAVKLKNAMEAYIKDIMKPFVMPSAQYKINDSIKTIVNYFIGVQDLVGWLTHREKKNPPFQIDLLLTIERKTNDYAENIDIGKRLTEMKCNYTHESYLINKNEKIGKLKRSIRKAYKEISDNGKNNWQRFGIFIDRTDKKEDKDKLVMFEPPKGCNEIPDNYLPEFQMELVNKCLIPGKDGHITASGTFEGELMTFSFQVGLKNDTKCLLIWNGGTMRFYGRHITQIFCDLFTNVDEEFKNDKTIKQLEKKIDEEMLCKYNFDVDI